MQLKKILVVPQFEDEKSYFELKSYKNITKIILKTQTLSYRFECNIN